MIDFKERLLVESGEYEQAADDIDAVVSALTILGEHYGISFDIQDQSQLNAAGRLAGYLRQCKESGKPTNIVEAVRECYQNSRIKLIPSLSTIS